MKLFEAQALVPGIGSILSPGGLLCHRGKVLAIGKPDALYQAARKLAPRAPIARHDFGPGVIFPGLVNAHAHLDYTCLRNALLPTPNFAAWFDRIGRIKRSLTDDDFLASIQRGINEAAATGTTTLCSIESFPQLLPRLPPPKIRVWWFYEMSDLRHRLHPDDFIRGSLMFFSRRNGWRGGFGLAPHSPYAASPQLLSLTRECARAYHMPWTIHVAESVQEMEMFREGSGPLFDFLKQLGRDMSDTSCGHSPLRAATSPELHPRRGLFVHLNYLDPEDWALIHRWGPRLRVIHCPTSHAFFSHAPFPFERLRQCGARIAIATDSGATGASLDLRRELRLFARRHPALPAITLWKMATEIPAKMLGLQECCGSLVPHSCADFQVIPLPSTQPLDNTLWDYLLWDAPPPHSVFVGGRPVTQPLTPGPVVPA